MKKIHKSTIGKIFLIMCPMFIFITLPESVAAVTDNYEEAQITIIESLDALWTEKAISQDLKKKQLVLKKMLENGSLNKTDLERIIKESVVSLLYQQETSRYSLAEIPEQIDELFSPYLKWEELRKIIWSKGLTAFGEDEQLTFTIGTLAPEGTPWLVVPEKLMSEITQMSNNKITFKIYSSGVMGEDVDILRKMDVGQLDGCGCAAKGISTASPETYIFLLPRLFNNYEEIDYVLKRFRKRIDKLFEEKGYILAALTDAGNFYLFSKRKISSLAELRTTKTMATFGIIETTLFEDLGISPIPVSMTDVISSLSTGMGDTINAPAPWMLGMQAYQYVNFYVEEPIFYSPAAIIVRTKIKDKMKNKFGFSDIFNHNLLELLIFEFNSIEGEWRADTRKYEKKCLEAFTTKTGMKVITLPLEDRKAIEQAGQKVWAELAGKVYPKEFLTDILQALKEYRQN